MLYPNTLQLSFLLGFSYSFLALPSTLGANTINSTLNAASSGSLDETSPVCVDITQHSTWGLTLQEFNFAHCQHAVSLITSRLEGDLYTSYDFYSRQAFPAGHQGWPLAQGAGAG